MPRSGQAWLMIGLSNIFRETLSCHITIVVYLFHLVSLKEGCKLKFRFLQIQLLLVLIWVWLHRQCSWGCADILGCALGGARTLRFTGRPPVKHHGSTCPLLGSNKDGIILMCKTDEERSTPKWRTSSTLDISQSIGSIRKKNQHLKSKGRTTQTKELICKTDLKTVWMFLKYFK